jgi:hypothetical protein
MIFLSYSREDSKPVAELAGHMKKSGCDVWMDVNSIAGGEEWRDQIAQGISVSNAIVLNVSPSSCSSDYVRKEVFFGIRHKKPIVPVMVGSGKSVELPYALELELGHLHFLRWPEDGLEKIISAIKLNEGVTSLPAENEVSQTLKESMESGLASLVSLAKDFIAYKRLVQYDPEMATLRAVRIASRALTYLAQSKGLTPTGNDGRFVLRDVLRKLITLSVISSSEENALEELLSLSERMSLDDILSPDSTFDASGLGVDRLVTPLSALLKAVLNSSKNADQSTLVAPRLEIVKGSAATKALLQQAFLVGQRTFGESVMPCFSAMERMHAANPDIYNLLVESSTGICIGYTSVVPVDQTGLEATLQKDFDHIPSDQILTCCFPGFYFVHLSSVAVDPSYRDLSQAYATLTNAVVDDFLLLAEKDIFIVGMSADAITTNGHRICKSLGMKAVEKRDGESTLFYGSLMPPNVRLTSKQGIHLMKRYKKAFDEMGDMCPSIDLVAK